MAAESKSGSRTKTRDSQIIPAVTIDIPMPPGAAIPAQSGPVQAPPQHSSAQHPEGSNPGSR